MKAEEPFDPTTITLEQLEERIRDIQEEAYQLKQLEGNPTWTAFADAVRANAQAVRASKIGRILGSVDDSLAHNYHCGLADGLDRAISLRGEIVAEIEQVLKELRELLKEKENAKTADDASESGRSEGSSDDADLFDSGGSNANGDASGEQFAP